MKQFQLWDEACGLQLVTVPMHTFFSFALPASPLLSYGFRAPIGRLCEAVLHICHLRVPGLGQTYLFTHEYPWNGGNNSIQLMEQLCELNERM